MKRTKKKVSVFKETVSVVNGPSISQLTVDNMNNTPTIQLGRRPRPFYRFMGQLTLMVGAVWMLWNLFQ